MRSIAVLTLTGSFLLSGCVDGARQQDQAASGNETTSGHNRLTDQEVANGWVLLFDGESIDQWRGVRSDSLPSSWQVQDDAIHYNGEGGGDIVTMETYGDFEFAFDWKISKAGNSGIKFRIDEMHDVPMMTGPEYQILDNYGHPDRNNGNDRLAGANYDMHPVPADAANEAGEWNTGRIVANGAHVEHWLNGDKVVEYELWSDEWNTLIQESKWIDYPHYGSREVGHIALQDHGDPVWYRNLKIRRLGE